MTVMDAEVCQIKKKRQMQFYTCLLMKNMHLYVCRPSRHALAAKLVLLRELVTIMVIA